MTDSTEGRAVSGRDIVVAGEAALDGLLAPDQLVGRPADQRHTYLEGRRAELFAVASVIADETMQQAWQARSSYPPYGLARSFFTQLRVVAAAPRPYEEGSITNFADLGRAYVDTVVFHLERQLAALRHGDRAWLFRRLDGLLALFRVDAGGGSQDRIRDPFSFLYGGLHFGTSITIEMVEVMSRLLSAAGVASEMGKGEVIRRSIRAPLQLAALNQGDVPSVYGRLHGTTARGQRPSLWLSADRFILRRDGETPQRIDIRPGLLGGDFDDGRAAPSERPPRYRTLGCPARGPVSGGPSAIATLWHWGADLALATGLLSDG